MNLFKKLILPLLILVLFTSGFLLFKLNGAKAQVSTQTVCTRNAPAHITLVMDRSGSMGNPSGNTKLSKAKAAAKEFVQIISAATASTQNKVGMVSFSNSATTDHGMDRQWTALDNSIDALKAKGETCASCGLKLAKQQVNGSKQSGIKNVVIFLTDGKANLLENGTSDTKFTKAQAEAVSEADKIRAIPGTVIYSIGIGAEVQPDFLKAVAGDDSRYFANVSQDQLQGIYDQIAVLTGGGSISGFVYNDANGNGAKGSGEQGLSGWNVTLSGQGGSSKTTGNDGSFVFDGLCNGDYTLSETPQTGWTQTEPNNAQHNYSITINGTNLTDKNFGNQRGAMNLNFVLGLDGIGGPADLTNVTNNIKGTGDFTNRNQTFGNSNPPSSYDQVAAQVCLYAQAQDDSNFCSSPRSMTLHFDGSTELYTGTLSVSDLAAGNYSIKVRVAKYLTRKVGTDMSPAKQTWALAIGNNAIGAATNQHTHSNLMVGDIDGDTYGDNTLNSVDWTIIYDCLDTSVFNVVESGHCTDANKADLNADGKVNQVDLNYFLRENRVGD